MEQIHNDVTDSVNLFVRGFPVKANIRLQKQNKKKHRVVFLKFLALSKLCIQSNSKKNLSARYFPAKFL